MSPLFAISNEWTAPSVLVLRILRTSNERDVCHALISKVRSRIPSATNSDTVSRERNSPFSGASPVTRLVHPSCLRSYKKL